MNSNVDYGVKWNQCSGSVCHKVDCEVNGIGTACMNNLLIEIQRRFYSYREALKYVSMNNKILLCDKCKRVMAGRKNCVS